MGRIRARLREIALAVVGILVFSAGLATSNGSLMSALLALSGACILAFSVMFWFLTPSRELRSEVCDAMALTDTLTINSLLATMHVRSDSVYVPSSQIGKTRLFLPLSDSTGDDILPQVNDSTGVSIVEGARTRGIYVTPPGVGLLDHARTLGVSLYPEGMEKEMRDTIVNALELASDIHVRRNGDHVSVAMYDIVNRGLCQSLRKSDPNICTRLGCPVCSLAGCMVAESTGRKARVRGVDVGGKRILLSYDLY